MNFLILTIWKGDGENKKYTWIQRVWKEEWVEKIFHKRKEWTTGIRFYIEIHCISDTVKKFFILSLSFLTVVILWIHAKGMVRILVLKMLPFRSFVRSFFFSFDRKWVVFSKNKMKTSVKKKSSSFLPASSLDQKLSSPLSLVHQIRSHSSNTPSVQVSLTLTLNILIHNGWKGRWMSKLLVGVEQDIHETSLHLCYSTQHCPSSFVFSDTFTRLKRLLPRHR